MQEETTLIKACKPILLTKIRTHIGNCEIAPNSC